MVDIEKMNKGYEHTNPVQQFRSTAGNFGCDLLELVELQGKLIRADAKLAMEKSTASARVALIGVCITLGSLPIAILGVSSGIAYYFDIETWVSQLLVGCGFVLAGLIVVVLAMRGLARSSGQFQRSADEFSKNVAWVKKIFSSQSSK